MNKHKLRHKRHFVTRIEWLHRFAAKKSDFARRIFSLERRQIHHGCDELESGKFGRSLDAAFGKRGRAFLHHDLIDN